MNSKWKKVKLKDIGKIITGKTPKTSIEDNYGGNIPFLTPSDNMDDKYIYHTNKTLSSKGLNEVKNCLIPKNSICVSCIGSDLGKVVLTTEDTVTNQQINSIIVNKNFDVEFIYYLMLIVGKKLNYLSKSSTAVPIINKSFFSSEIVTIPFKDIQIKISYILSTIDKKIEINKKINHNLEEQIKSLFKSWFLNFDIFEENELIDSEFGKIPKIWKIVSLGDVTCRIKDKVGAKHYKVLSAINTGHLQLSEEYFSKQVFSKNIEKYLIVKENEFAYNPARINIGSIGINDLGFTGCVSPVYVVFKSEEKYEHFMNMFVKTKIFKREVELRAYGSVRQTLNWDDFSLIRLVYPSIEFIEKYNEVYESYHNIIKHNNKEIEKLTKLRDILLPKLMSGEIDVSNIKI